MYEVRYRSNNSGGNWWLTDNDWRNLENAGWDVEWKAEGRWLGALATSATKDVEDPSEAIEEFERITGEDISTIGCTCCGPPHEFSAKNLETGESTYPTKVIATAWEW